MNINNNNTLLLFVPAICLLVACGSKKKDAVPAKSARQNSLTAEGFVVNPERFERNYTASGALLPNEEIQILSEVAGRVTAISFSEGATVAKGQVLLQVYNDDIKAQIRKSRAQKELQEKIKARQAELLQIGGISQQDYETTTAQIQSLNADIAYAEAMLRKTTIIAPFSGRIGIRNVSTGAVISPTTVIATLQQVSTLKLDFTVPDQYRDEVSTGKRVSFTINGKLDTFAGVISAIEPTADAVSHTVKVRAIVKNDGNKLMSGSFAHVVIPFGSNTSALLIPSQAIIPTGRDKKVAVIKDGKARMTTVVVGTRTNDMAEILQGLTAGDTIIITGIMQVKNDMDVKVSFKKTTS
ncbi:MAG: efflux RND transporter periplasmic adaptor subunit [Taibaiella sp.]|nr:efflux RND transporter periplasmic adaptor subunit [Taibaiella sp.]